MNRLFFLALLFLSFNHETALSNKTMHITFISVALLSGEHRPCEPISNQPMIFCVFLTFLGFTIIIETYLDIRYIPYYIKMVVNSFIE